MTTTNLDYFSIPTRTEVGHHHHHHDKDQIHCRGNTLVQPECTSRSSTSDGRDRTIANSPLSLSHSTDSSPINTTSPSSQVWDVASTFKDPVVLTSCIGSFSISPDLDTSAGDINFSALKSDQPFTDTTDSTFLNFAFDDWMRWDDLADSNAPAEPEVKSTSIARADPEYLIVDVRQPIDFADNNSSNDFSTRRNKFGNFNNTTLCQTSTNTDLASNPLFLDAHGVTGQQFSTLPPSIKDSNNCLYSTPLSWDSPKPDPSTELIDMKHEQEDTMDLILKPMYQFNRDIDTNQVYRAPLPRAQESHLRSIAMPHLCGPIYGRTNGNINVQSDDDDATSDIDSSSEESPSISRKHSSSTAHSSSSLFSLSATKRHKSSNNDSTLQAQMNTRQPGFKTDAVNDDSTRRAKPMKKTAHNMIEKRYRNNLNDKIAMLRDAVPSLRAASHKDRGQGMEMEIDGDEDLQGLTPANKLNKATVLSKATEYILHLEKVARDQEKRAEGLQTRIEAFETLFAHSQFAEQQRDEATRNCNESKRVRY